MKFATRVREGHVKSLHRLIACTIGELLATVKTKIVEKPTDLFTFNTPFFFFAKPDHAIFFNLGAKSGPKLSLTTEDQSFKWDSIEKLTFVTSHLDVNTIALWKEIRSLSGIDHADVRIILFPEHRVPSHLTIKEKVKEKLIDIIDKYERSSLHSSTENARRAQINTSDTIISKLAFITCKTQTHLYPIQIFDLRPLSFREREDCLCVMSRGKPSQQVILYSSEDFFDQDWSDVFTRSQLEWLKDEVDSQSF